MKTVIVYLLALLILVKAQDGFPETALRYTSQEVAKVRATRADVCGRCDCTRGYGCTCVDVSCKEFNSIVSPASQTQVSWMTVITLFVCLNAAQLRSA